MDLRYINKVKRRDRLARWLIRLGGGLIILSVIAILVMIAQVAVPLFLPASTQLLMADFQPVIPCTGTSIPRPDAAPTILPPTILAVGADDFLETGYALDETGAVSFYTLDPPALIDRLTVEPPNPAARRILRADWAAPLTHGLTWDDGSFTLATIHFRPEYDTDGHRTIAHEVATPVIMEPTDSADGELIVATAARVLEAGGVIRAVALAGGPIHLTRQTVTENFLGEATAETLNATIAEPLPGPITALAVDTKGTTLYAGTDSGHLLRWELNDSGEATRADQVQAAPAGQSLTALAFVLGDISLAVGDSAGNLATWFPVHRTERLGRSELTRIHLLRPHAAAITAIFPSPRDKTILCLDAEGRLSLDHMTSERRLLELGGANHPLRLATLAAGGRALVTADAGGGLAAWQVNNPHPEISLKTLFRRVWYENYREPAYVWQSTAMSDDVEAKLSLTPLIFGTLKGTCYAMLFALPLAVFGAIYTSQFMRPGLRRLIKPAVEIMAAIPSVVIGFLAGLWLAPRVETSVVSIFLAILFVPAILLTGLLFWQRFEARPALRRLGRGHEFLLLIPLLILSVQAALWLGPWIEATVLGAPFPQWLYDTLHKRYDQRNNIIIAFALGFAVIPIIFTISDDALSNVPRSLTAASLALGASRWQTAWRVALPSASPGIFAAAMIGLGRAVGETMIVLMATGNTPIIDWSIFNGMRTLSANIAVEIPEAPYGGTLYRVLFLTAVLLFVMTFVLNTAAELVRQRLRKKYGRL